VDPFDASREEHRQKLAQAVERLRRSQKHTLPHIISSSYIFQCINQTVEGKNILEIFRAMTLSPIIMEVENMGILGERVCSWGWLNLLVEARFQRRSLWIFGSTDLNQL